jgi:hypothetical protein
MLPRRRKIGADRFVDRAEIRPRVVVRVKTIQKQQVGEHAVHPIHIRHVADDRAAIRRG